MKNNKVIKILKEISIKENINIYVVGGFVRDFLMNRESNDIDITSKERPENIKNIFEKYNFKTYCQSEKHGTIGIKINNEVVEHTTFRTDKKTDGRHATIQFSKSILADASRRDFTINAFYYDIVNDRIIDFFNGKKDLAENKIRFIFNPYKRLEEDHLRLFRAFRFAMRLDFNIDDNTYKSMSMFARETNLNKLSSERILSEINKMFKYMNRDIFYSFLDCVDTEEIKNASPIIKYLIEMKNCKFNNHHHIRNNVLDHALDVFQAIKSESYENRFIGIFHDMFKIYTKELNKKGEHSFIGHDKIWNFKKELNEFKNKSKINNNLMGKLEFFIATHMAIKNLNNKKSFFSFIYKFLLKEKSYKMFKDMKEIYIADDISCSVDSNQIKDIIENFEFIFEEIHNLRKEIIKFDRRIDKRFIMNEVEDKRNIKRILKIIVKNSFVRGELISDKEIINIIKSSINWRNK